jgi:hypothetical protein
MRHFDLAAMGTFGDGRGGQFPMGFTLVAARRRGFPLGNCHVMLLKSNPTVISGEFPFSCKNLSR